MKHLKKQLGLLLALVLCVTALVVPAAATVVDDGVGDITPPARPTATVTPLNNPDLSFALNFLADPATEEQLAYYGSWYADFVLTLNKTTVFNADGNADGYLSGQYDAWSENWVDVPFDDVTVEANQSLKIMEYAASLMGQAGLKYTYAEVYAGVKDFDCGVYFDPEFLEANKDLVVTLALRIYNPEDETESYAIGDTYTFKAEDLAVASVGGTKYMILSNAIAAAKDGGTVTMLKDVTLTDSINITDGMDVTIEGDGKTITGASGKDVFYVTGGKLTLASGLNVHAPTDCVIYTRGGDVFTSANLTKSGEKYSVIQGNGNYAGNVTITGGTITSNIANKAVIYWPQNAKLTITGGTITGGTPVRFTSGSLEITGGSLIANGAKQAYEASNGGSVPDTGDALLVENVSSYPGISSISITGGTFTSANAEAVTSYASDDAAVMTKFISGGIYSSDVTTLCADGYSSIKVGNVYNVHKHEVKPVAEQAKTCTKDGIAAHYACAVCELKYSDAAGTTAAGDLVIPASHTTVSVEAQAETCHKAGNIKHYKCTACEKLFSSADAEEELTTKAVTIKPTGILTKIEANEATCTKEGNKEHYKCTCGMYFSDAAATTVIDPSSVVTTKAHTLTLVNEVPSTDTEYGMQKHYQCSVCKKFFIDEEGLWEVTEKDLLLYPNNYHVLVETSGTLILDEQKEVTVKYMEQTYYTFTPAADGDYLLYTPSKNAPMLLAFEVLADNSGMMQFATDSYYSDGSCEGQPLTLKAGTKYVFAVSGCVDTFENLGPVSTTVCITKVGPAKSLVLTKPEGITLYPYSGYELVISGAPTGSTVSEVTFTSSDPSIASVGTYDAERSTVMVSSGSKAGTVTITATDKNGATGSCEITVEPLPVLTVGAAEKLEIKKYQYQPYTFTPAADGTYSLYHAKDVIANIYVIDMSIGSFAEGEEVSAEGKYGFAYTLKADHEYFIQVVNSGETDISDTLYLTMDSHVHNLKKVEAKAATYTTAGNIEHWACAACGDKFSDAEGKNKIANVILPQLIEVVGNKAEVSEGALDVAMQEAGTTGEVKLDLTHDDVIGVENKPVSSAQLPVAALEKVAEADASLTLTKADATVTMDTKALTAVAKQAEGSTVTLVVEEIKPETLNKTQQAAIEDKKVAAVISAELICAETNKNIGTEADGGFGGGTVTVKIPFTPEKGFKGSDYVVVYVADDGSTEEIKTSYKDGCLIVDLEHFSDYVVVNTAAEDEEKDDNKSESKPTSPIPNTGDDGILMPLVMMLSCAAAVVCLVIGKKKFVI